MIEALIVVGILLVSSSAMSETGRVVTRSTLDGAQIFELVHHRERASEEVVSKDPKIFDLRTLAPSSAFATNDVYIGWIRSDTNGVGFPVWTNRQPTFEGLPSARTPFSLLAVQTRSNELFLCYKLGPLIFGEVVNLNGKEVIGPRTRALLRRDSPLGPDGRILTNAVFVETDVGSPHLVVKDSWGAEFTWKVTNSTFEFLACKTNAPKNLGFGWPEIYLQPPERWVWDSSRWNVEK